MISEMVLIRTPGLGVGPGDRLVLRKDGAAEYVGTHKTPRQGRFRGRLSGEQFDRLAKLLCDRGFFELQPRYHQTVEGTNRPVTDAPTTTLTVTRDGKPSTVVSVGFGGPRELREIHAAILDLSEKIAWQKHEG